MEELKIVNEPLFSFLLPITSSYMTVGKDSTL